MPKSLRSITLLFKFNASENLSRLQIARVCGVFRETSNPLDEALYSMCNKAAFPLLLDISIQVFMARIHTLDPPTKEAYWEEWFPLLNGTECFRVRSGHPHYTPPNTVPSP
ncbi:hypothetical protein LshimejAT787_0200110 [Lyophyllum shimeji]|uniref:Uncharacterized protein n=1 Tax=Lyophyllum shimeji TaxID=47721 RepID=A0A9P3PEK9_LYOSH|nr:hypothetical protein LshimejAT787_0200110 [Lyophyllum shimeji]